MTGGIGCGKSTVAAMFATRGASIIDTDAIAHQLSGAHGAAMPALLAEFGAQFATPEGALDRPKMRALVFGDPGAKQRLEAILHPQIRAAAEAAALAATGNYLMYVVPLLIESGSWRWRVQRVLVIDCTEARQLARVMERNGLSEAQVKAMMATQVARQVRLAAADDIINNDAGIEALAPQVDHLHHLYMAFSERMATLPSTLPPQDL